MLAFSIVLTPICSTAIAIHVLTREILVTFVTHRSLPTKIQNGTLGQRLNPKRKPYYYFYIMEGNNYKYKNYLNFIEVHIDVGVRSEQS